MDKPPARRGAPRGRTLWLFLPGAALVVALGACSNAGGTSSAASTAERGPAAAAPNAAPGAANAPAAGGQANDKAAAPADLPLQIAGDRAIIYNGTMTVRVSDVDAAAAKLGGFAAASGGYVSTDQRSASGISSTATVTLRIPADKFYSTVNQIGTGLDGKEESRQISAEDVTAKLVDLTSRVKTQQASVDRIRLLMNQAKTIADVTTLESELSRREADLESLEAQQRDVTDLSTLSTITVTLLRPDAPPPPPRKKPATGFVAGLTAGWHAFTASLQGLLTVLGAVLPFLIALGVPVGLVLWLRRRRTGTTLRPVPEEAPVPSEGG